MGLHWTPIAPPGKCDIRVPVSTQFFTDYLPCNQDSYDYCTNGYCEKHCDSSCVDSCEEYWREKEMAEMEKEKRRQEREEHERNSNHAETGHFETNSERQQRESNEEKWQIELDFL